MSININKDNQNNQNKTGNDYYTNHHKNNIYSSDSDNINNSNNNGDRMLENHFPYHNFSEYDVPKNFNVQESNAKINGVIFLIWFIVSIFLMIIFSNSSKGLSVATFGQMFLIIGLSVMKKTQGIGKIILSLFPISGTFCIIWGLILTFGSSSLKAKSTDIIIVFALLFFLLIGIGMIVLPIYNSVHKKKICTERVTAIIKDINSDCNEGITTYAPCYEYTYGGVTYRKQSIYYTNLDHFPKKDGTVTLLIDPDNPDNYYEVEREKSGIGILTILGLFWTVISASAFFVHLFNNIWK